MLEGLEWIREKDAYCVIFTQGLDATELLHRLGGDQSTARLTDPDERWEVVEALRHQFAHVVQVGWCDGWAFAYEWSGLPPTLETMRALSAGTAAVSVYRNTNGVARFCYVEDGTVVADFDPIDAQDPEFFPESSPRVQALLRQAGITSRPRPLGIIMRGGIPLVYREGGVVLVDHFDYVGAMHALAEAAGVRLDRESIAEKPLLISGILSHSAG